MTALASMPARNMEINDDANKALPRKPTYSSMRPRIWGRFKYSNVTARKIAERAAEPLSIFPHRLKRRGGHIFLVEPTARILVGMLLLAYCTFPVGVFAQPSVGAAKPSAVVWVLGADISGVMDGNMYIYYSPPPEFARGALLADGIVAACDCSGEELDLLRAALGEGIPVVTNSSGVGGKLDGAVLVEGGVNDLLSAIARHIGRVEDGGSVVLSMEVIGFDGLHLPYKLVIKGIDNTYYSSTVLDDGFFSLRVPRGVYWISLEDVLWSGYIEPHGGYISVRRPEELRLSRIYFYDLYFVSRTGDSFGMRTAALRRYSWEEAGITVFHTTFYSPREVERLAYSLNGREEEILLRGNRPGVILLTDFTPRGTFSVIVENAGDFLEGGEGIALLRFGDRLWAEKMADGEISLPIGSGYLAVYIIDNATGLIRASYEGPPQRTVRLRPRYYLVANVSSYYAYVLSKGGAYVVDYELLKAIGGGNLLVVSSHEEQLVVKLYMEGQAYSLKVGDLTYGRVKAIDDLADAALREAAYESLSKAREEVERMTRAVESVEMFGLSDANLEALVRRASLLLKEAEGEYGDGRYILSKYSSKAAREAAAEASKVAVALRYSASSSALATMGIVLLLSLSIGSIVAEGYRQRMACAAIAFYSVLSLLVAFHPGFALLLDVGTPLFLRKILLVSSLSLAFLYFVFREFGEVTGGAHNPESEDWLSTLSTIYHIAAGSLRRRRMRTVLTIITVSVSIMSFTAFTSVGYSLGIIEVPIPRTSIVGATLKVEGGFSRDDLVILRNIVPNFQEIYRGSAHVNLRVSTRGGEREVEGVIALSPSIHKEAMGIHRILVEGKLPSAGEVVVSDSLARSLKLRVGDVVEVLSGEGYILARLKVSGIFSSSELKNIRDADGQSLLPQKIQTTDVGVVKSSVEPSLTLIVNTADGWRLEAYPRLVEILVGDPGPAREAALFLADRLGVGVAVAYNRTGTYLYRGYVLGVKGPEAIIVLAMTILVAVNAMLASVYEKRRELHIYSSLGMSPLHARLLFSAEATLIGVVGGGIGHILGMALAVYGIHVPGLTGLRPHFSPEWSLASLILAVGIMAISTVKPAEIASLQLVPSFERRWKLGLSADGYAQEILPFRVERDKIGEYIGFVKRRIESAYPPHSVLLRTYARAERSGEEYILRIQADLVSEGRASAEITLRHRPSGEFYLVEISIKPLSITGEKYHRLVYSVVDEIRKTTLAWEALYRYA